MGKLVVARKKDDIVIYTPQAAIDNSSCLIAHARNRELLQGKHDIHRYGESMGYTRQYPIKSDAVLQRLIFDVLDTGRGIDCKADDKRPPGNLPGRDGDHTTPFTMLQGQVVNAIVGVGKFTAWRNLEATLKVYKGLPGFATSKKQTQECKADMGGSIYPVQELLENGGDLNQLTVAANVMVALRNQIDLSARESMGGGGKGEPKWAGALQDLERKFYLEGKDPAKLDGLKAKYKIMRDNIIVNMILAFDHGRVDTLDPKNKERVWKQHCITVTDAYPQLAEAAEITYKDLLPMQQSARDRWFEMYRKN